MDFADAQSPVIATASGPPTSGWHRARTLAIDVHGVVWICLSDGEPGAWEPVGSKEIMRVVKTTDYVHTAGAAYAPLPGASGICTSRGRPYDAILTIPFVGQATAVLNSPSAALVDVARVIYPGAFAFTFLAASTQSRGHIIARHRFNDPAGTARTISAELGTNVASSLTVPASAAPVTISCVEV